MIGLVWNARGLGGSRAFQNLQRLLLDTSPDFVFISESRIGSYAADVLKCKLKFQNCFYVLPVGSKGGLILFWNDLINLVVLSYSLGHIDCLIDDPVSPFYFTDFYGHPS